jgi:glucokinase
MKKLVASIIVWGSLVLNQVFALTIETVDLTQTSTPVWWQANRLGPINTSSDSYLNVINIVNDYLWFALAAVCVGTLVYAGIRLMTARWDKAKMQQANRALVGMVIGLGIAYFSYTIVRIIANWF